MSVPAAAPSTARTLPSLSDLQKEAPHLEVISDVIDQHIDLMLNHRQSGHPGGSRSKVQVLVTTLLSGVMRWDIRHPEKPFADRFVLVAGHTTPLAYAVLAVFNEALRYQHEKTGDPRYAHPMGRDFTLLPEDLLDLRRNGGLPGHAEMEGKTLFFKFNTGPSGHGTPAAAGEALALKLAGLPDVRVFAIEGEGGHTAGANHETKNSAYGLGLGNLFFLLDWNDFGIDPQHVSRVVAGTPQSWFEPYGWNVDGTLEGADVASIQEAWTRLLSRASVNTPNMLWVKTRKGRGYLKMDAPSHGSPHKPNDEKFWATKKEFADRYGVSFEGMGEAAPKDPQAFREQTWTNLNRALDVLREKRPEVLAFLADRLVELGESVPKEMPGLKVRADVDPARDPRILEVDRLPEELFEAPGANAPNRQGFARYAAYVNAVSHEVAGRPLFIGCAADLADSTNLSGFAKAHGDFKGFGWYDRDENLDGCLLPQEITEFTNSGIMAGLACVNLSPTPFEDFRGYFGACSTYGSFSYLKYGLMRLFSQVAQDSQIKTGKVIWVAGHSGPETAEDSRTHFGIFAPGVTQLFPRGQVINLHPWEHNEVAPCLAAALSTEVPIIALHLTRPGIPIPDRQALGMADFREAAKGLYVMRPFDPSRPPEGTVICQGTSVVHSMVQVIQDLKESGPNVRVLVATSHELFRRQPQEYRDRILPWKEWQDSMVISSSGRKLMSDWYANKVSEEYSVTSDWDDRWRTGGSLDEIIAEAHLDPVSVRQGLDRFAAEREERLARIRDV